MKKEYSKPMVKICQVELSDIIATSPGIGGGSTDTMYSRGSEFEDEEDY